MTYYDDLNEPWRKDAQEAKDKKDALGMAKLYSPFGQSSVDAQFESQMNLKGYKKEYTNGASVISDKAVSLILRNAPKSLDEEDVENYLSNQGIWMNWKKK